MEVTHIWAGRHVKVPTIAEASVINLSSLGLSYKTWQLLACALANNLPENPGPTEKSLISLLERTGFDVSILCEIYSCEP